jgi:SAM-dependent methyltransferase
MKARLYDWMYRRGAPWEIGPRSELVELVESEVLTTTALPRAIDLGCGSGANALFLAEHGFDVVGVDFSLVALSKAQQAADEAQLSSRCRFVEGDLTAASIPGVDGPFDLLVDYGTLDDLRGAARLAMTATIRRLSHDGSRFLLWCFQAERSTLPWMSFSGPSRVYPGLAPGEQDELFGDTFAIERLPDPPPESRCACYLLSGPRARAPEPTAAP